jgi:ATP-dependent DNA helicase PIF1
MRAQSDPWFSDYFLRIGNGTEDMFVGGYIHLPRDIVIEYKDEHSIDHLINCVFPDLSKNACSTHYRCERGILCMRNDYVDDINARTIDRFPGRATVLYNFDSVDDDARNNYLQDFLTSITPNCMPPHELGIKINCPLILLRNLDPHSGLCHGTHLVVRAVNKHIIDTEIVNGTHAGDRVFIPRNVMFLFEVQEEVVSCVFERHDDYQQGTKPDAANCWCMSTRTSIFTWAIICWFIEG